MKYKVCKTDIIGVGPWYVSSTETAGVLGMFRKEIYAQLFCDALNDVFVERELNDATDSEYAHIGTPFDRLVEECGELLQAASKINRFGPENRHPDGGPTNLQRIMGEWMDLKNAYSRYISSVFETNKGSLPPDVICSDCESEEEVEKC